MAGPYKAHKFAVDDLVLLPEISEDAVLDAIHKHYQHDEIYSYIGEVLISVNPYKQIKGLYGPQTLAKYKHHFLYENPPHVYAVSDITVRQMIQNRANQCVIISGESGAGKTEASKKIMEYVAAVSSKRNDVERVKEQILESNPLLEAFGNAKTVRNNNSSRFGKYFEIEFNYAGDPVGGRITQYLLEKSRVVRRHKTERSFHIFYQMLNSYPDRAALGLQKAADYRYLSMSEAYTVQGINDAEWYAETSKAMDVCGFSKVDKEQCFRLIATSLTLGNLEFSEREVAGQDNHAHASDRAVLEQIAKLLQCDTAALEDALTHRSISTMGETMRNTLTAEQAAYVRDSLATGIYHRLFQWVVVKINQTMFTGNPATVIGVLDIYGFEIFDNNSFEQLCINFVNEKLQQIFIELTLRKEQEEYVAEGIKWTPVEYYDNKPCCDMIEKRAGLFDLLDEECLFPKGTDESFLNKLRNNLKHDRFIPTGNGVGAFGIKHFAGEVHYESKDFLDKNKDQLYTDLIKLMNENIGCQLGKELFANDAAISKGPAKRPLTAGFQFKNQVASLMDALKACVPHYIRCIKPNDNKQADNFDLTRCREQVQYLGLVENVRVRRAGFAFRLIYSHFMQRFKMCTQETWPKFKGTDREGTEIILNKLNIDKTDFQFGKTKVFIKSPQTVFKLEEIRDDKLNVVVRKIQKAWRAFVLRRFWLAVRAASQDVLQGKKARRKWSINRRYHGDYINLRTEAFSRQILASNNEIQILFADRITKYRGKSFKPVPRGIMITEGAVYTLALNPKATQGKIKRRIPLTSITSCSLSALADNYVVLHATPYDLIFTTPRKTELVVALKEHFREKLNKEFEIKFSNSLSCSFKSGPAGTVRFVEDSNANEDAHVVKEGAEFVVHVKPDLPPTEVTKSVYQPPDKRRTERVRATQRDAAGGGAKQNVGRRLSGFVPPDAAKRLSRRMSWGPNTAECIEDYTAAEDDELSMKKGDIINVMEKNLDGWWRGELHGQVGDFPSVNVRTA